MSESLRKQHAASSRFVGLCRPSEHNIADGLGALADECLQGCYALRNTAEVAHGSEEEIGLLPIGG